MALANILSPPKEGLKPIHPRQIQNTRNEQINLLEKSFLFSLGPGKKSLDSAPLRLPKSLDSRVAHSASKSGTQNNYFTPINIKYNRPTHVVM